MEARVLDEELRNVYPSAFEANSSRSASQTRTMFSAAELPTSVIASTLSHLTFLFSANIGTSSSVTCRFGNNCYGCKVPQKAVFPSSVVKRNTNGQSLHRSLPKNPTAYIDLPVTCLTMEGHQPWNWSNKCSGQLYCPIDQTQSLHIWKPSITGKTLVSFSLRGRKKRVHYAKLQLKELEREYTNTKFITKEKRRRIAFSTNPSQKQLTIWFQNRRVKDKKRPEICKEF
uniref:Homeobox D13a n=1 Tax=Cyprinus carpio TaxID=7962 RepID=A0A8C1MLK3_CYPCA